jgi:hypothetical protein
MERLRSFLTVELHANLVLGASAIGVGPACDSFSSQHAQPASRADGENLFVAIRHK